LYERDRSLSWVGRRSRRHFHEPDCPVDGELPAIVLLEFRHRSSVGPVSPVRGNRAPAGREGYPGIRLDLGGHRRQRTRARKISRTRKATNATSVSRWTLCNRGSNPAFPVMRTLFGADISHQVALRDDRVAVSSPWMRSPTRISGTTSGDWAAGAKIQLCVPPLGCHVAVIGDRPHAVWPPAHGHRVAPVRLFERDLPPQERLRRRSRASWTAECRPSTFLQVVSLVQLLRVNSSKTSPTSATTPKSKSSISSRRIIPYLLVADRERLIDRIENWVTARFRTIGPECLADPRPSRNIRSRSIAGRLLRTAKSAKQAVKTVIPHRSFAVGDRGS